MAYLFHARSTYQHWWKAPLICSRPLRSQNWFQIVEPCKTRPPFTQKAEVRKWYANYKEKRGNKIDEKTSSCSVGSSDSLTGLPGVSMTSFMLWIDLLWQAADNWRPCYGEICCNKKQTPKCKSVVVSDSERATQKEGLGLVCKKSCGDFVWMKKTRRSEWKSKRRKLVVDI